MTGHRSNRGRQKLSGERALGQVGQFAHAKARIAGSQFFVELNVARDGVDVGQEERAVDDQATTGAQMTSRAGEQGFGRLDR